ncbi:hypothetical protein TNCT_303571 [Trichonephila clavata]|uniref:Uncharacterized protein n=1 Tax=Trichonephila clavata TaxID=2740835 RepID=A0A8X6II74_TRICU|nr:hypothetical protein TNCT_303571 [Trichonephila clavata]
MGRMILFSRIPSQIDIQGNVYKKIVARCSNQYLQSFFPLRDQKQTRMCLISNFGNLSGTCKKQKNIQSPISPTGSNRENDIGHFSVRFANSRINHRYLILMRTV